jgi:hypothetical protein
MRHAASARQRDSIFAARGIRRAYFRNDNPDEVTLCNARALRACHSRSSAAAICRVSSAAIPRRRGVGAPGSSLGIDVQGFSLHRIAGRRALKHVETIRPVPGCWPPRREGLGSLDTLDIGGGRSIGARPISAASAPFRQARRAAQGYRCLGGRHAGPSAGVAIMAAPDAKAIGGTTLDDGLYDPTAATRPRPLLISALRRGEPLLPSVLAGPLRQHRCDRREPDAARAQVR